MATGATDAAAPKTGELGVSRRPVLPRSGIAFSFGLTAFEIGLSILLFQLARSQGASEVGAYLVASAAPLLGAIVYLVRARSFSGASAALFAFTVLSSVIALAGGGEAKLLLYKDAGATGLVGLIFLATLVVGRPLAFYFGQRFATGGPLRGSRGGMGCGSIRRSVILRS